MDVSYDLVRHVSDRRFEDLPPDVVDLEKWLILDCLGGALAGSTAPPAPQLVSVLRRWGGTPESTLLAHAIRLPAALAAWANATMAHTRDFNDTYDSGGGHTHPSILMAALAAAEAVGGVSGRDLMAAVALATDVMCRLARARTTGQNFLVTSTVGSLVASLAAGKVMGLSLEQLHDAFGIAYQQVAGTAQALSEGKLVKRMETGFAARNGVSAAYLARAGVDGPRQCLEGRYGYFTLYERGSYDRTRILEGLGQDYLNRQLSLKPYPCARDYHGAVEAALTLCLEHDLKPEEVASATVWLPPDPYSISGGAWPPPEGATEIHAFRSAAYGVAAAIVRRRLGLREFSDEARGDEAIRAMASRVTVRVNADVTAPKARGPQLLELTLRSGRTLSLEVDRLKGDPARPMAAGEILEKFHDCSSFSARPLSQGQLSRLVDCILSLEELADVASLTALLE